MNTIPHNAKATNMPLISKPSNSNVFKTVPFVSTNLKPTITITPTASTFSKPVPHLYISDTNTLQSQLSNNNQSTHNASPRYTNQSVYFPKVNIIDSNFHNIDKNENNDIKRNTLKETQYEFQQQSQSSLCFTFPQSHNFNNHYNNDNVDNRSLMHSSNNNTNYVVENNCLSQINDIIKQSYDEFLALCVTNKECMNHFDIYDQLPSPIVEGLLLNGHILHVLYYEYVIHNFLLSSNNVLELHSIEENTLEIQILDKLGEVFLLDHVNDFNTHSFQFVKTKNSKLWHIYLRLIDVEKLKNYYGTKYNGNNEDKWDAWNKQLNELNKSKLGDNYFYQACDLGNSELQFVNFVEKLKQTNECYEKPFSECQMPKLSVLLPFQQVFYNVKNNLVNNTNMMSSLLLNNNISNEQNEKNKENNINIDNANDISNSNSDSVFQQHVASNLSSTPNGDNVEVTVLSNIGREELNKKNIDNNCAAHKRLRPSKHQELMEQKQQKQKEEVAKFYLQKLNDMDIRLTQLKMDKLTFDQTEGIGDPLSTLDTPSLPTQQENVSSQQNLVDFNNVLSTPQGIQTQNQVQSNIQYNNVSDIDSNINKHTDDNNDLSNCFQFPTQPIRSQLSSQQQHQPSYTPIGSELNENDLMVNNNDNNDQSLLVNSNLMNSMPMSHSSTISSQSPSPASSSPTSSSVSSSALQSPFPWANVTIQNTNSISISIQYDSRKKLATTNNQQSSHTFYNPDNNNTSDSFPDFMIESHPKSSYSTLLNMVNTIRYDHRPKPPSRVAPQLNHATYRNELTSMYSNINHNHNYNYNYGNNAYHKRNRNNHDYHYNYKKWRKAVEYERAPRHQKYAYNQ